MPTPILRGRRPERGAATRCLVLAALALAVGAPAAADDREARQLYGEAVKRWRDPDPKPAAELLRRASEAATTKQFKLQLLLIRGQFHQGKTGDFKQALACYDQVVAEADEEDKKQRQLKAAALLHKASVRFTEDLDGEAALKGYAESFKLEPTPLAADYISQLSLRVARASATAPERRRELLLAAEKHARHAVRDFGNLPPQHRRPEALSKLRLQLVIVLTAQGQQDEAGREWARILPAHLGPNTQYQEALLLALQKKPDEALAKLQATLAPAVRPDARARNQLRRMIRSEPDFGALLGREGWKDLVRDEPEKG